MEQNSEQHECFICFEVSNQYEKTPSRLNNIIHFLKNCHCNGWVHNNCLEIWHKNHETCPICRNKMIQVNFELQYGIYIVHYFILSKKYAYILFSHVIKLRNFIFFCVIVTNIMNIVSIALHNFDKNGVCNDYEYMYDYGYMYDYDYMYEYNYTYYYPKYIYNAPQIL